MYSILILSQAAQAKRFEIELSNEHLVFFDNAEPEFNLDDKEDLNKAQLSDFFLNIIAIDLLIDQKIPWTSHCSENINDIFNKLLTTFKYDPIIYYISKEKKAVIHAEFDPPLSF